MGWVCLWTCVSHPGELQKYVVALLLKASNMCSQEWVRASGTLVMGKIWNFIMCVILELANSDDEWHFLGVMQYFSTFGAHQNHMRNLKNAVVPRGQSVGGLAVCSFENSPVNAMSRKVWGPLFRSKTKQTLKKKNQKQGQKSEEALTLKTQAEKDEPWEEDKKQQSES